MENNNELRSWVNERLDLLEPPYGWKPDADAALQKFQWGPAATAQSKTRWVWGAIAASVAFAILLTLPSARAVAQRLWQLVSLNRLEVVRVDFDDLPDELQSLQARIVSKPQKIIDFARDVEEASRIAGFPVRLPKPFVLSHQPELGVFGPLSAELILNVAELESALRKAGASDVKIPKEWDGMRVGLHSSPLVIAGYPGDITVAQCRPFTISAPPGFQLGSLTEAALRILGMNAANARRFAGRMAATPAWLLGISEEDSVTIREVTLRSGPGTLIHDLDDEGKLERVELLWSTPDRLYLVSALTTDEMVIAIANAID